VSGAVSETIENGAQSGRVTVRPGALMQYALETVELYMVRYLW